MATFTTQVRDICGQQWLNQNPGQSLPSYVDIIPAVSKVILPISVSSDSPFTADSVAQAILRHYWMREIGLETVSLWQYFMVTRLQEILPKYVEIAKAQEQMGNIFDNFGYQESGKRDISRNIDFTGKTTDNGTSNEVKEGNVDSTMARKDVTSGSTATEGKDINSGTTENTGTRLMSDTPQNGLQDVVEGNYLTEAESNTGNQTVSNTLDSTGTTTNSGESDTTGSSNTTDKQTLDRTLQNTQNRDDNTNETVGETDSRTRTGFTGDKVKTMWDYSQLYVNIYQMIIGDVADLFMSILG